MFEKINKLTKISTTILTLIILFSAMTALATVQPASALMDSTNRTWSISDWHQEIGFGGRIYPNDARFEHVGNI